MIKEKERIISEKSEKISHLVKEYIDSIDNLSETDEFTIDNIEKMWQALDESAKEVYREIGREVIEQMDERKIIQQKKRIRREGSDAKK